MHIVRHIAFALLALSGAVMSARAAETPLPGAIAAPGETVVLTVHAEGAQVYECKAGADGKSAWVFREPIATLLVDGPLALLTADERARAIQRIGDFALDGITAQPAAERASAAQPPADPAFRTGSAG